MDALIYKDTIYGGGGAMRGNYFNPIIYSTEEREVGVWTNNKPLYQKTCVFGSVSGQTASLSLGIANVEEAFLCADASYVNDGTCPLPYVTGTAYANNIGGFFDIGVNDTSFAIRIGQSISGYVNSVVLTVRYTKTTDVAGSGQYTTLGIPAVHYSTDEQVIGTWFGETLYENFIDLGSATIISPNGVQINIGSIDVKQPVNAFGIYDLVIEEAQTLPLLWYKYNGNMYFSSSTTAGCNKLILQYTKTTD